MTYSNLSKIKPKLRQFLYVEIKKIHIQRGTW